MSEAQSNKAVVVIIGSNTSFGPSLIQLFAEANFKVYCTYFKQKSKDLPPEAIQTKVNLQSKRSISRFYKKVYKLEGQINILIHAAGLVFSGPLEGFTEKQIRQQMEVNYFGVVSSIQEALPGLKSHGSATIVNISSLCGITTFPMLSIYHASKWALEGLTESLHYELMPLGIKIKLVEIGGIENQGKSSNVIMSGETPKEYKELLHKVHHTKWFPSFVKPEEVANKIFEASTDEQVQLRYQIGNEISMLMDERQKFWEDESFIQKMQNRIGKNNTDD